MASKITIKQALIRQGYAASLAEAEKLLLSKRVLLSGQVVRFGGEKISEDEQLALVPEKKYFSRAGEKLDFALQQFAVSVQGKVCADVGASTGGFTGVLLGKEAKKIYAIDVARGEIAWKLRNDPAVVLMERTNVREVKELPEPIELVTIDVSFISLGLVLPNVRLWLGSRSAIVVVLVKPQFEAPRELVEKGGVIRDKKTHLLVLNNFIKHAENSGFLVSALCRSPIEGMQGNREFLAKLEIHGQQNSLPAVSDKQIREVCEVE